MSNIKGTEYSKERGEYGEEAVDLVCKMLKKLKIPYETCKQIFKEKWNPRLDRIYGDIRLFGKYWFDVKRNSITERSIDDFSGIGYFLVHHNLSKAFFVGKNFLHKEKTNMLLEQVQSGEYGYKFKNFYKYDLLSIEQFIIKYFKS